MYSSFSPNTRVTNPINPRRIWMPPCEAWQALASCFTSATGRISTLAWVGKCTSVSALRSMSLLRPHLRGFIPNKGITFVMIPKNQRGNTW